MATPILCIIGPTASGKSSRGVDEARARNGEILSVDSRQVYRGLDIGTEKITQEEMRGVPHHLLNIREVTENYSAGDFVTDATQLISEITKRGKVPILVGGTHFYFDALLQGLPLGIDANPALREELERLSTEELSARVLQADPRRAGELDPKNRRRLIRALEIIAMKGSVPERTPNMHPYIPEWIVTNPSSEVLRTRIDARLAGAFDRGLIDEVQWARETAGDTRLNELGLEYKIIGEFLRSERSKESLIPTLSSKLWQYARRQKAWLRKLSEETIAEA